MALYSFPLHKEFSLRGGGGVQRKVGERANVNHSERNPAEYPSIQDVCPTTVQEQDGGPQQHSSEMCVHLMSIS